MVNEVEFEFGVPDVPVPFPAVPEMEASDKVLVDEEDMVVVATPKRGRPRKLQEPELVDRVVQLYFVERLSMRKIADSLGVSHMSVYRLLKDPNLKLLL